MTTAEIRTETEQQVSGFATYFKEELENFARESHLKRVKEKGLEDLTDFIRRAGESGRLLPMLRQATYRVDSTDGTSTYVIKAETVVQFCGPHLQPENLGLADDVSTHLLARMVLAAMRRSFTRKLGVKGTEAKAAWAALCRDQKFGKRIESAPPKGSKSESELGNWLAGLCRR